MTDNEAAAVLAAFNEWRRGDLESMPFDPATIGRAIDVAVMRLRTVH